MIAFSIEQFFVPAVISGDAENLKNLHGSNKWTVLASTKGGLFLMSFQVVGF